MAFDGERFQLPETFVVDLKEKSRTEARLLHNPNAPLCLRRPLGAWSEFRKYAVRRSCIYLSQQCWSKGMHRHKHTMFVLGSRRTVGRWGGCVWVWEHGSWGRVRVPEFWCSSVDNQKGGVRLSFYPILEQSEKQTFQRRVCVAPHLPRSKCVLRIMTPGHLSLGEKKIPSKQTLQDPKTAECYIFPTRMPCQSWQPMNGIILGEQQAHKPWGLLSLLKLWLGEGG